MFNNNNCTCWIVVILIILLLCNGNGFCGICGDNNNGCGNCC